MYKINFKVVNYIKYFLHITYLNKQKTNHQLTINTI
jgi:hypothetical protein